MGVLEQQPGPILSARPVLWLVLGPLIKVIGSGQLPKLHIGLAVVQRLLVIFIILPAAKRPPVLSPFFTVPLTPLRTVAPETLRSFSPTFLVLVGPLSRI